MAIYSGPNYITNGLILNLDANNLLSYPNVGSVWYDTTENPINFTLVNSPTYINDIHRGFSLNGINQYFNYGNLPSDSKISFTGNFTITQIFKPTGYQPNTYYGLTNVLLSKGNLSTVNYLTQLTNDTTVTFIKRSGVESLQAHNFTVPNMLNNINQMTFVINASSTVTCYMNGVLIDTLTIKGSAIESQISEPTSISIPSTGTMSFIGEYYSCKIYNKPLNENEIIQNFNAIKQYYYL